MLRQMSGRELAEWMAFEAANGPLVTAERVDRGAALVAERITNTFTEAKSSPDDFMPLYGVREVPEEGATDGDLSA